MKYVNLRARAIALSLLSWIVTVIMCAARQEPTPDLVLLNGKIFTSNVEHPFIQALAIRGDRIVAAGDSNKIKSLAGANTRVIDLSGRTVIPGINDVHQHITISPPGAVQLDLQTRDPEWSQLKEAITAATQKAPKGAFILATIGSTIFHDPSIARDTLDRVSIDRPVILSTVTHHAVILNSAALTKLGIREDQKNPVGGKCERSVDGKLSGVLREYAAMSAVRISVSMTSDSEALAQFRNLFRQYVKFGITSVQDMSNEIEPGRAARLLKEVQAPIRIRIIRNPLTTLTGRDTQEGLSVPRNPAPLITVSGTKWFLDGVMLENTFTPQDVPSLPAGESPDYAVSHLPLTFPEKEIPVMLRESLDNNDPIMFHISGYPGARAVLDAMQATGGKAVWTAKRVRFEHGDGLFPDLIPCAKEMGIVLTQNPTHFDLSMLFGPTPLIFEKSQPLRSLIAAGIPVALGSDGPMNPYLNIMLACTHPGNPAEAITREQAVISYTLTSAYAEFQEKEKGSLETGKLADLAVLSQDIFSVPLSEMPKTESVLTLVGGRIVYDAKVVTARKN